MATTPRRVAAFVLPVCVLGAVLSAQTVITPPKNKYTPEQDVKLGKEAAAEVRKQYPIINDQRIARYLTTLGDRLVAAAPAALNNRAYEYSFTPVNVKEINAFALPGGPMFVNRGMFEAAAAEGEVVGVMAHELSHVLLRHGTANLTKAQNPWLQLGQLAGAIGGGVVGGAAGSAIAQGSQLGLGAYLMRYSRDYEKQADLLGAQIMARAGYDPRALAHMFETIERESQRSGGGGNPEWLSSHPNPGNRTQYINKEATTLTIAPAPDQSQFESIKASFSSLPKAKSMAEVEGGGGGSGDAGTETASVGVPGQPVPRPSGQYRALNGGNVFQASVPSEWTDVPSKSNVKAVPQNGYGQMNGQTTFTHGVEFGITQASSRDLVESTRAWLNAVAQSNPDLRLSGSQQQTRISQRTALATSLVNRSPLGGEERIGVYTTMLQEGVMFYYLTVVPAKDDPDFRDTFSRIAASIRLTATR